MNKCILIPDSFKGTLSSTEICDILEERLHAVFPECTVIKIPVADGGEGTVDCFLKAIPAQKIALSVTDPYGESCTGYYAKRGTQAILEMAMFAGLPRVEGRENPALTTTFGVGEAIRQALKDGCTEILLGLGGSCTNDGGTGMAAALGVVFTDEAGIPFVPTGGTLNRIAAIDATKANTLLQHCTITAMCDIDNPLFGKTGAAQVFAPQKGADPEMVKALDEGLRHLSIVIARDLGKSVADIAGAGAAGGMGAGVLAFLGGSLKPGIQAVLDQVGFDEMLPGTDLVITGEGRLDSQSLRGKVVIGVAGRAKAQNVPVLALVGSIGEGAEGAYALGVTAIMSINRRAEDFSVSRYHSKENLAATAEDLFRFWRAK